MTTDIISMMADLGEGYGGYTMGDDLALLDIVTSANIACGFHAGDPIIMDRVTRACVERGVSIGAHPGFQDLRGFGRRTIVTSPDELRCDVLYQVGALQAFAHAAGADISHVTPHGRLGNLVMSQDEYAKPVADAMTLLPPGLPVATSEGRLAAIARQRGMAVAIIGFADRAYNADGTLVSRGTPGAVLQEPDVVAARAVRMATEQTVETIDGRTVHFECDSLLVHGDNQGAVEIAARVRARLEEAGVRLTTVSEVLAHKGRGPTY